MATVDSAPPQHETAGRRSRLRWVFVALLVVGGVINYLDRNNISIANTTIAKEFDLSAVQMGLILAAFSWPYAIANLPAGYLVDKLGPKRMYALACTLWSIVSMVSAAARGFGGFYAARAALGVAEAPFFTAGLKVCERWFRKDERALPVSIINTGSQIANAIAPPLLTFLMLTLTWRGMFLVVGAAGFVVVVVWLKVYRDPSLQEEASIKGAELEQKAAAAAAAPKASWGQLLTQRNTWFMVIGAFGIFYTVWVYLTWLPSFLENARGFSLKDVAWLAALPYLCGIVGVLTGGVLSSKAIKRGVPTIKARKIPIVGGAVLAAAAVLPVAYIHNTVLTIVLLCVGYFAAQVPIGVIWTLASDIALPSQVASLGAIQNFGGFLGAAVAPIVTGYILDRTGGSFNLVFVVGGILLLVGALSYGFFVKERRPLQAA